MFFDFDINPSTELFRVQEDPEKTSETAHEDNFDIEWLRRAQHCWAPQPFIMLMKQTLGGVSRRSARSRR